MTSTVPYTGLQLNFKTDSSGIPLPPGGGRLGWGLNGRVYDPWLARFLSPDPFVQSPGYSQSYNRYSYCLNNPLKYTDPSGYTQININSIIELLLSSHYGGSWSQSGGLHFYSSNEEALAATIGNGSPNGTWVYQRLSTKNKGDFKWKYPWICKGNGTMSETPVYGWVLVESSSISDPKVWEPKVGNTTDGDEWHAPMSLIDMETMAQSGGVELGGLGVLKNVTDGANYASGVIGLTQIGMLEYRMSLPLSSKIGTFSSFSSTYRGLGFASKTLGRSATYIGAPLTIGFDYSAYRNGEISGARFGYRTVSLGVSIGTGAAIGGPWGAAAGAAVGGISIGAEYIYDNVLVPLGNEIQYQIWNFENAIRNGWYPGR
jgi:hypothetical protein